MGRDKLTENTNVTHITDYKLNCWIMLARQCVWVGNRVRYRLYFIYAHAVPAKVSEIIKVVFLLKARAPTNLKTMQYFVATDNYEVAQEKANICLREDIEKLAVKFRVTTSDLLRNFNQLALSKIDIIR